MGLPSPGGPGLQTAAPNQEGKNHVQRTEKSATWGKDVRTLVVIATDSLD